MQLTSDSINVIPPLHDVLLIDSTLGSSLGALRKRQLTAPRLRQIICLLEPKQRHAVRPKEQSIR